MGWHPTDEGWKSKVRSRSGEKELWLGTGADKFYAFLLTSLSIFPFSQRHLIHSNSLVSPGSKRTVNIDELCGIMPRGAMLMEHFEEVGREPRLVCLENR